MKRGRRRKLVFGFIIVAFVALSAIVLWPALEEVFEQEHCWPGEG